MVKVEMSSPEYLGEILDRAGGSVTKAAALHEPPVSSGTMRKWLLQADLITREEKNRVVARPVKLDIPSISLGDSITYQPDPHGRRQITRTGVVVDQTEKLLILDLGRYRDTILKSDLTVGQVKLISISKGEDSMTNNRKRIDRPSAKTLADIFERAAGNISKAA